MQTPDGPKRVDMTDVFQSVIIWCEQFSDLACRPDGDGCRGSHAEGLNKATPAASLSHREGRICDPPPQDGDGSRLGWAGA